MFLSRGHPRRVAGVTSDNMIHRWLVSYRMDTHVILRFLRRDPVTPGDPASQLFHEKLC